MKKLFYSFICLLLLSQPAMADDKVDAEKILQSKINEVLGLLQKGDLEKKVRNEQILEIVKPLFNFNKMAKLSLGKKHWKSITKAERKEYTSSFIKRLQESYLEKLDLYSNEDIVYDEPKLVKKKIQILSHLVSKDNNIDILYKMYKSKKLGWQVYDFEVQGVSVVVTYRSQFDDAMKKDGIKGLLAKLKSADSFTIPDGKE